MANLLISSCRVVPLSRNNINGTQFRLLNPSHGLFNEIHCRHVYSFAFVKAFIRLVRGNLQGIWIVLSASVISYVYFTDNSLLFSHATTINARSLGDMLHQYANVCGQVINMEKSSMSLISVLRLSRVVMMLFFLFWVSQWWIGTINI